MFNPKILLKTQGTNRAIAIGKFRWLILSLIFFATTINYLDRQVISLLKDDYLEKIFQWSESDYADIVIAFQLAYAIGMLGMGWFIDQVGTKLGYAISLAVWSLAAMGHAMARSTFGFIMARGILGLSEAGNFPAAVKTVAEWFPQKERALATGIFNSGTNIGAIVAPLAVPLIAMHLGWQWAYILTGALGLVWLIFWFALYEIPQKHPRLNKVEFEYIHSDKDEAIFNETKSSKQSWIQLLTFRQTWAFLIGKLLTDPVWWFYLFWLPSFLNKQYGLTRTELALPIAVVYSITTIGSIFGGWLSGFFIKSGWPAYRARRIAMLVFALFALPVVAAQALGQYSYWYAVLIVGIATAGHQAWAANLFTTVSDMFPKKTVASVVGIGTMAGCLTGMLISKFAGLILDYYKALGTIETGYYVMFLICGSAYLLAWVIFNLLVPQMKRAEI
ncbi:MAG: MFS transporter [candidate division KSB1 bacterium]|nr:MFS transporter [candidate division KSB1 bacterium]